VLLAQREDLAGDIARYELRAVDGGELPAFDAGAHIDVVVAPEYLRQFSLAGDPADRSRWVLGVLAERQGRGGSALMHRAFRAGRRVFVSRPINHFPLDESAAHTLLFAGGIGITPLLAMAHRLHALGRSFELHYSAAARSQAGFVDDLLAAPWAPQVRLHFKDEGCRADLGRLLPPHAQGWQLYTCGSPRYMDAVFAAAAARAWPPQALHREYFSLPEDPDRIDRAFVLKLARSGRSLAVPADRSPVDVLADVGIVVPTKCSDGLCGICITAYDASASGEVEHRDVMLGAAQRQRQLLLCCSRMKNQGDTLVVDL
jgi:ferredoxin-NADP reductase